jgi:hypothetical protein
MRVLHRLVFVAAALVGAAGCKQGVGDRCQVNDDCESPLMCSAAHVCFNGQTVLPDANVPSDARIDAGGGLFPDARPSDAGTPDAPPASPPDAPVPDAA